MRKHNLYRNYIKRLLDIIFSLIAIIVLCWLFAILAILVRARLGKPVLFTQDRPGKDEQLFSIYKFRTMTDATDAEGNLLSDEERLTQFGKRLRRSSLDELPELCNILKGDMSIIGPRPLLVQYLPRYNDEQHRRHEVRPGLSGWAQVNGRNAISWEEKFAYDVWYVDHVSFGLDVKIIGMTIKKAFVRHEGISSDTSATMEEFMGTKE